MTDVHQEENRNKYLNSHQIFLIITMFNAVVCSSVHMCVYEHAYIAVYTS
jgi:hypothetical protein